MPTRIFAPAEARVLDIRAYPLEKYGEKQADASI